MIRNCLDSPSADDCPIRTPHIVSTEDDVRPSAPTPLLHRNVSQPVLGVNLNHAFAGPDPRLDCAFWLIGDIYVHLGNSFCARRNIR
jgi:hypothetical protein